jgi:pimeloyl-ACP methyl ester carboxylesterase
MKHVQSADGTAIAYQEAGEGSPVILVAGAFCTRDSTAPLAAALADRCRVFNVDRRGRGDSGDAPAYAVQREIEDLGAVIEAAGGSAAVFGHSSGATLALRAGAAGLPIPALVLYEPPILIDDSRPAPGSDLADRIAEFVAHGRRGDAVELFQLEGVGLSAETVAQIRTAHFRPWLESLAHTLPYDAQITGDLSIPDSAREVTVRTLVLTGSSSWPFLQIGAAALAQALTDGQLRTLEGDSHDINPETTANAILDFLAS